MPLSPLVFAFCGFYVAGSNQPMFNDATQVVLMRSGTRTVLSMQNNYKGPIEAFAMVIPVPSVLHEGDVKTLTKDVFDHVEQMGAPRLVEYWEQDPCAPPNVDGPVATGAVRSVMPASDRVPDAKDLGVKIEAQFAVGEYQIVILSAKDSTGLETWLHQEHYTIPAGAEPLLRPYVEAGSKFFVARVDPQKVKFVDGRAALSPLRFHYDADRFELPIRLGLASSSGTQDLIVNILAPAQRYQVANYPNVTIPTNLDVRDHVKAKFGAFYAALFDRTLEKHPGAIITEYAWQATTCDPCPGPALGQPDFLTLGGDVLAGTPALPQPYQGYDFVLTRLHARYGKDIKDDLVFQAADPIAGGRERLKSDGKLEEGAVPDAVNNFQGRYAIRHSWTGPIRCTAPRRNMWGGPPPEVAAEPSFQQVAVKPALGIAFAPRNEVPLATAVTRDVPEIDLHVGASIPETPAPSTGSAVARSAKKTTGCGCQSSDASGLGGLVFGLALLFWRNKRP